MIAKTRFGMLESTRSLEGYKAISMSCPNQKIIITEVTFASTLVQNANDRGIRAYQQRRLSISFISSLLKIRPLRLSCLAYFVILSRSVIVKRDRRYTYTLGAKEECFYPLI